jgi:non-ribosomal peptide synthetase component F
LRPALQTFHGAIRSFDLSERLTDAVRQLSKKEEVTLFNILLVGFSVLLHCYTEQSDIVIGTLSSSRRKRIEFQGLLGHFLNPIALRIKLSSDSSFSALIRQSHKAIAKAMTHDEVPIEILADSLMAAQDANRNSLFNVAISLQPKTPSLDGWTVTSMDGDSGGSIWAFYLAFIEQSKKLSCRVQYDPELIEGPAIAQLEKHLDILLSKATQDPNRRLSDFRGLLPTYA